MEYTHPIFAIAGIAAILASFFICRIELRDKDIPLPSLTCLGCGSVIVFLTCFGLNYHRQAGTFLILFLVLAFFLYFMYRNYLIRKWNIDDPTD